MDELANGYPSAYHDGLTFYDDCEATGTWSTWTHLSATGGVLTTGASYAVGVRWENHVVEL